MSTPLPELLSARQVGELLGISRSEAYEADRAGLLPAPVKINTEKRWRTREILDWLDAGLPPRADWRYRPSVPAKLDDLIRVRTQQLNELQRELTDLHARRVAGESHVPLSKG